VVQSLPRALRKVKEFESEWFDRIHTSKAFTIRTYQKCARNPFRIRT